jgi:hypothetical protein
MSEPNTAAPPMPLAEAAEDCARGQPLIGRWTRKRRRGRQLPVALGLMCGVGHAACGDAAENPCAQIRAACVGAGFVQGAAQAGNGLQQNGATGRQQQAAA